VKIIYDASSLINLANGGVLDRIISDTSLISLVGPQVLAECSSIKSELDLLIENNELLLMSDEELPAETYFEILEKYRLGPGETECIAFARQYPDITAISCDDRRARNVCAEVIGESRLTGTIGRLKYKRISEHDSKWRIPPKIESISHFNRSSEICHPLKRLVFIQRKAYSWPLRFCVSVRSDTP
jgi:predicted nucleic acid-binding protein